MVVQISLHKGSQLLGAVLRVELHRVPPRDHDFDTYLHKNIRVSEESVVCCSLPPQFLQILVLYVIQIPLVSEAPYALHPSGTFKSLAPKQAFV